MINWAPHYNNFYKAVYKDKWLIIRKMTNDVEYCIFGDKNCKGTAPNMEEAERVMKEYIDESFMVD